MTSWSYAQFDYWQGSSLAGCFTGNNFARRLRCFFTSKVNTCKSDHTAHFYTSSSLKIRFQLGPLQTVLLICFRWKRMECKNFHNSNNISIRVSPKLPSQFVLHSNFHSIRFFQGNSVTARLVISLLQRPECFAKLRRKPSAG